MNNPQLLAICDNNQKYTYFISEPRIYPHRIMHARYPSFSLDIDPR